MSARSQRKERRQSASNGFAKGRNKEQGRRTVEQLERELERLREQGAEKDRQIREQQDRISKQQEQIADLQRQLAARKKNSTNSKPPSSEGLVLQFRSSLTYFVVFSSSGRLVGRELGEKGREIGYGELPFKRFSRCFPVVVASQ